MKVPPTFQYVAKAGKRHEVVNKTPSDPLKDPASIFFACNLEAIQKLKLGDKFSDREFVQALKNHWVPSYSPLALENRFKTLHSGPKLPYYDTFIAQEHRYGADNSDKAEVTGEVDFDMFLT